MHTVALKFTLHRLQSEKSFEVACFAGISFMWSPSSKLPTYDTFFEARCLAARIGDLPALPTPPKPPSDCCRYYASFVSSGMVTRNSSVAYFTKACASWGTLAVAPPAFSPVIPTPVTPRVMIRFGLCFIEKSCVYIYPP